jgi:hypothetical protein
MNTKTLLIIFACLLVLLALLSAFGGSIRVDANHPYEGFYSPSSNTNPFVTMEEYVPPEMPRMPSMTNVPVMPATEASKESFIAQREGLIEPFENLETPSFGPY